MHVISLNALNGKVASLKPAAYFRLTGGTLYAGPDEREVGTYEDGFWLTRHMVATRLVVKSSAKIRFSRLDGSSSDFGPCHEVTIEDGAIRHGAGLQRLLARLDEQSQRWHVYPGGEDYPVVFVLPATAGPVDANNLTGVALAF
jgi:hypothetical protein